MHFDVVVEANTAHEKAIEYGKKYLASVGQEGQKMTQEECQFCHARSPSIGKTGYRINRILYKKMEGCS